MDGAWHWRWGFVLNLTKVEISSEEPVIELNTIWFDNNLNKRKVRGCLGCALFVGVTEKTEKGLEKKNVDVSGLGRAVVGSVKLQIY